jgi:ribosomal protein L29
MAAEFNRQISELSESELALKANELRRELFDARLKKATARLEKTHIIGELKRNIARCETRKAAVKSQLAGNK